MKKFEQFTKHLRVLQRANQQDLQNEFVVSREDFENIYRGVL